MRFLPGPVCGAPLPVAVPPPPTDVKPVVKNVCARGQDMLAHPCSCLPPLKVYPKGKTFICRPLLNAQ